MAGLYGERSGDDPLGRVMALLDSAGYESVVATNYEQIYHRYLELGEQVTTTNEVTEVFGPKQTALGESWFINIHAEWRVGDELVNEMNWRIMKFRPGAKKAPDVPEDLDPSKLMRPSWSRDSAYFWEGVAAHELRLQSARTVRCSIRRCPRSGRTKRLRSSTRWPAAGAPCTATWCITRPRCLVAHCLS